MGEQSAYTAAGVSQADADSAVAALMRSLGRIDTGKPSRVVPLPGHYASVLRLDEERGIAFGADGVGTKMVLAERMERFGTVGIDCIAMCVNDLICVGAEPIAMVDTILCRDADPDVIGQIGEGLRRGAELSGIEIPGGEIAQVGDVVGGWELSGAAIGLVDLDRIVDGSAITPGDALIGLPSSGLHSNGYTLARKALAEIPLADERLGRPLGDALLEPTTIYVGAVRELLASGLEVHGLAHITGDGLNNLLRLSTDVGYELTDPLEVPPVFGLIAEEGGVSEQEMYEVFNMGLGFVCVVAEAEAEAAVELLGGRHPGARRIGEVTGDSGAVIRAA
ncbi:MAG: phosphoribosylformylglycinamidine cyclo-ligase [Solirubrobacterales bacterium]